MKKQELELSKADSQKFTIYNRSGKPLDLNDPKIKGLILTSLYLTPDKITDDMKIPLGNGDEGFCVKTFIDHTEAPDISEYVEIINDESQVLTAGSNEIAWENNETHTAPTATAPQVFEDGYLFDDHYEQNMLNSDEKNFDFQQEEGEWPMHSTEADLAALSPNQSDGSDPQTIYDDYDPNAIYNDYDDGYDDPYYNSDQNDDEWGI